MLFVTHFLDQVYRIADRITVLRNGRLVGEYLTPELPRLQLVSKMIGRELAVLEALETRGARRGGHDASPRRSSWPTRSDESRASLPSISSFVAARCSAWPGCSGPVAPRPLVCSSVPTAPTAAP